MIAGAPPLLFRSSVFIGSVKESSRSSGPLVVNRPANIPLYGGVSRSDGVVSEAIFFGLAGDRQSS